jgi:hypothetical protein
MQTRVSPSAVSVILILMATTSVLIMLSLNQINSIVHGDLYAFDLKFSHEWAIPYWILSGIIFGLSGTNIALSLLFTAYVQKKSRRKAPSLETSAHDAANLSRGIAFNGDEQPEVQVRTMTEKTLEVAKPASAKDTPDPPRQTQRQEEPPQPSKAAGEE